MPDTEHVQAEEVEVEVESSVVLATLSKAELDIQIATAKSYPRSVKKFKQQAGELATLDAATAGSMFYSLKRGGKAIEGPSVRLAEIVGSSWGNLRYGARVIDIGATFVTAQGMAFDMERNLASTIEVRRRITNREGQRFSEDMITVTANAAMSIALRNAIFKVVPFALVKSIYEDAKQASLGKGLTMEQRRENAMRAFAKFNAKPAEVCKVVGRAGPEDLTIEDLITLKGMETAIKEGDTTWKELLAESTKTAGGSAAGPKPSEILNEEKKGVSSPETAPAPDNQGSSPPQASGSSPASASPTREPGDESESAPESDFKTSEERAKAEGAETINPQRVGLLAQTAASAGLDEMGISEILKPFGFKSLDAVTNEKFSDVLGRFAKLPPKKGKK